MATEAQRRAKQRYDAKTVQYVFRLRMDGDSDVIDKLKSVPNKTDYLRSLVRQDIDSNHAR